MSELSGIMPSLSRSDRVTGPPRILHLLVWSLAGRADRLPNVPPVREEGRRGSGTGSRAVAAVVELLSGEGLSNFRQGEVGGPGPWL